MPSINGSAATSAGDWPVVPPVPKPVKPEVALAEPRSGLAPVIDLIRPPAMPDPDLNDDSPTTAIDASAVADALAGLDGPPEAGRTVRRPGLPRLRGDSSPVTALREPVAALLEAARRRIAVANQGGPDQVWQPRFAYGAGAGILLVLVLVSLPLWVVLWRVTDAPGTPVSEVIALCMMIMGGFLTAAALWSIVVEMRARVRIVDTLARTADRELVEPASTDLAHEAPSDGLPAALPKPWRRSEALARQVASIAPITVPILAPGRGFGAPTGYSRLDADVTDPSSMVDASGRRLSSFGGALRSFGQLPAQLATLGLALCLFVFATILSLN